MAKQRKKTPGGRPLAARSTGGAGATGTAAKAVGASASNAVSGVTDTATDRSAQAANRIARKEEARRQREATRRKQARRRVIKRIAIIGGATVVIASLVFLVTRPRGLSAEEQGLLDQAPAAAAAAGCGDVQTIGPFDPASEDQAHIGTNVATTPPLSSYTSQPPTSGPHNQSPLGEGVYPTAPPYDQVIHSLEHGAVVIWYSPAAVSDAELATIQEFFRQAEEQDHIIVAPYDYPDQGEAGQLPEGKNMVMTAWHRLQTCDALSLPVAFRFAYDFATPTGGTPSNYRGEAPEAGAGI